MYFEFRLIFAYTIEVFNQPEFRLCDFTIRCKGCGENIPAPVATMPDSWIIAECPLCGERRAYLPPEIFRGRLSHKLTLLARGMAKRGNGHTISN